MSLPASIEISSAQPARRGSHLVFGLLYFSEGAPIGFLWWAMPTLLRAEGVAIERITALTAALVLPWTLKFLWAPLVDAWRGPRWGFRHWAAGAQIGMGLALLPLVFIDPAEAFGWWFFLLLTHAVFAATQDVAIDALAVVAVEPHERGRLNAAMQVGMLAGRSVLGGGAIVLASRGGWPLVMGALIAAVWISLVVLLTQVDEPGRDETEPKRKFGRTLRAVLSRRTTWFGLGFALLAGAGFEATGALAGPLLVDLGVPTETTGWFFALPVVAAMAIGGIVGGRWADRGPRPRRVGQALIGLSAAVMAVGLAIHLGAAGTTVMLWLGMVYLGIGCFTASSYALFMDLTDRRLGATQFSTFMAATNGCEAWAAGTAGYAVASLGYGPALMVMAVVGLAGLWFLRAVTQPVSDEMRAG
ncbi:MFS transporter [Synoicihabitans lomoniglobus]|uniref:MFS transporter n=1 Tax=Synoicihabitans lomoniglobus TaxID=2909285 RepID=A0AAE9ZZV0_9BACT|nr:MFS transporter [Opitutaceae bacterium LMO-M01]WED64543.1 MFS transporter [Opitutaceae bacterium LMO-M01]